METAGIWMLAAAALAMIVTGLPTWIALIGVTMAFALGGVAAGVFGMPLLTGIPSRLVGLLEQDLLQALPLYVLMGALLNRLPLAQVLFRVGARALRATGAGPALAGMGLGVLLAPMNGSVGASVAMLARTVSPRLHAAGMPDARGAALVCVASTLGVVIPPSLVLILLGDAMLRAHTEAVNITHVAVRIINTQDVFRGALVPAAVLLAGCVAVAWWTARRDAAGGVAAAEAAPTRADQAVALVTIGLILGLLGAVTAGYMYAVEAAATGGVALFLFGLVTRSLTRAVLMDVLRDTMAVTGALFALLLAATVFTLVLRAFGTDRWIAAVLTGMGGGPYACLFAVLAMLAVCAFVLDAFEMIFVVIPVVMPPLLTRVPDATVVAVLTLLILQLSFLLPPFGYAVLMVRNRLPHPVSTRALGGALAPYVAIAAGVLALVLAVPAVVWRGPAADAASAQAAKPLSEDAIRAEFERMQREQQQEQQQEGTAPAPK